MHAGEKDGDEARKVFCTFTWALCCWLPISPSVPERIQSSFLVLSHFGQREWQEMYTHPSSSSFLVAAGPTSTGRGSSSLIRKTHPGTWKKL